MPQVRRLVRRLLAAALYYSGLLWAFAAIKLRGKAVVLMYHRVLPIGADSFSAAGIVVRPETFAAQMQFLKRHFQPLTIEQFRDSLAGNGFRRRACLITFDDGWQDNRQYAWPILQRYAVPATVFIATGYAGTDRTFWQEALARLLFAASRLGAAGHEVLEELGIIGVCRLRDDDARHAIRETVTLLKQREPAYVAGLTERLESAVGPEMPSALDHGQDRFMNWDDIQELSRAGTVHIGTHAHSHIPLPKLGYVAARDELTRSRQELAIRGLAPVWVCAYPNGDVDDETEAAARDAGCSLAFTTAPGHVSQGDPPMRLRRINVHEGVTDTNAQFLCRILGVL